MPFANREYMEAHFRVGYAHLICENCQRSFGVHYDMECPSERDSVHLRDAKYTKTGRMEPIPKTVCSKVKKMYERQPYYKRIHHV